MFQAAEWLTKSRRSAAIGIAILYLSMNAMVLTLILEHRTTFWYAWTVPAWCGLYGLCRVLGRSGSTTTASTAVATSAD
jgi:hypothetical protein